MSSTVQVILGWLAFAGSHTLLSHPLRSMLVAKLGDRLFQGLYSLVALGIFVPLCWVFFSNRLSTAVPLPGLALVPGPWWITMLLMALSVFLLVAGLVGPSPLGMVPGAGPRATGVLRITRHPAFMAFALIGLAHLFVNHQAIDHAFFGCFFAYSVVGSMFQDARKRRQPELAGFFAETSIIPFAAIVAGRQRLVLSELGVLAPALALVAFATLFAVHHRIFD